MYSRVVGSKIREDGWFYTCCLTGRRVLRYNSEGQQCVQLNIELSLNTCSLHDKRHHRLHASLASHLYVVSVLHCSASHSAQAADISGHERARNC